VQKEAVLKINERLSPNKPVLTRLVDLVDDDLGPENELLIVKILKESVTLSSRAVVKPVGYFFGYYIIQAINSADEIEDRKIKQRYLAIKEINWPNFKSA